MNSGTMMSRRCRKCGDNWGYAVPNDGDEDTVTFDTTT
jgi:hypothetical protein